MTMCQVESTTQLDAEERAAVRSLVEAATLRTGRRPLSDDAWLDLTAGDGPPAVLHRAVDGSLAAAAQLARGHDSWSIELVDGGTDDTTRRALVAGAYALVDELDGDAGPVHWWAHAATAADEALADQLGLRVGRRLLQMRRHLPTGLPVDVTTRAFVPGEDDEAWLAVNNRSFAEHPEQGGWDLEKLHQRMAEPWFDPDGFRLHERDGRLAAFCWTKLHHDEDPPLGEIYVIGVDPDFQGLGLGPQLTLAGLASIADRGITTGMLFVDGDNRGAVAMYERLGFEVARTDLAFVR